MVDISNNSKVTVALSTVMLLLFPTSLLLWIILFGQITLLERCIVMVSFFGALYLNFWLNFLVYSIYYNTNSKEFILKRLGKIVYKSANSNIDVQPIGIYAMSFANFNFVLDGKKFRFRSPIVEYKFGNWIDKKSVAQKIRANIIMSINRSS